MLIDETQQRETLSQVYLVAPRVTDGLYLLPQKINKELAIACLGDDEKVPYFEKKNSRRWDLKPLSGNRYWQGVRAAAISAVEILVAAATRRLDIERGDLEAVEPRLFRRPKDDDPKDDEKIPMIQIVDRHVNGAGFSDWLGSGDSPPILDVLKDVFDRQAAEWSEEDHRRKCQEACYRCLKSYDNQNLHGLLDWRLGLAYLRSFTDPDWKCGLDGNFEDRSIEQWPELAFKIREDTLKLQNADEPENKEEHPLPGNSNKKIYAFKLGKKGFPWVIIRHPLWRWGLNEGPLADFARKLDPCYEERRTVICWDTFNTKLHRLGMM